jgi:CBS domain-containing protein
MNVKTILKDKGGTIISIGAGDTIASAAKLLAENRIGAVVVLEGESLKGILSERDIVRGVAEQGDLCLAQTVASLMTSDVVTCAPDDTMDQLMAMMTERRIRHLPIMEDGKMLGLVSIGDVVKQRIAEAEMEAAALRDYISSG